MGDSPILEVLIGLVVVFLTLSLVCSAAIEALASGFGWRAETLRLAIARLLGEKVETPNLSQRIGTWWKNFATSIGHSIVPMPADRTVELESQKPAASIYSHPFVLALRPSDSRDPSYIPNETFAEVLLDRITPPGAGSSAVTRLAALAEVVRPQQESTAKATVPARKPGSPGELVLSPDTRTALGRLFERARTKAGSGADANAVLTAFRAEIAQWYQDTMDRASGWYRRHTQVWLFIVATIVVIPTNADTLELMSQLARNPAVRAAMVAQGEALSKTSELGQNPSENQLNAARAEREKVAKELTQKMEASGLQLGWGQKSLDGTSTNWLRKICGLLITIFAVSLGAPFWFQILEKLVKLRASGARIAGAKSADETPEATTNAQAGSDTVVATVTTSSGAAAGSISSSPSAPSSDDLDPIYWTVRAERSKKAAPSVLLTGTREQVVAEAARLSALAYEKDYKVVNLLPALGYADPDPFEHRETQVFVADVPNLGVVVSFRGTEPAKIQDLMTDARIAFTTGDLGDRKKPTVFGRVHGGFLQALEDVRDDLDKIVAEHCANTQAKRIVFTGHSLGAALATLYFAHHLALGTKLELSLVTFGSPRVGDGDFVTALEAARKNHSNATIVRVVNDRDLVTRVAPRAMGFGHLDPVCFLDSVGKISWDADGKGSWVRFLSTVVDAASDLEKAAKGSLEDHAIARYVHKLDAHEGAVS